MTPTTRGPGQTEPDPVGPGRGFRGNTGRDAIDPRGVYDVDPRVEEICTRYRKTHHL